ncbi:MAG TPA: pyridoxamine 5'-phosphate oxidase family protein [Thermomicrobiales bacterium]|nr:pyridoxamine 5'-phosphate oxidase family protein [Thermomicrobiales bacterium]
MFGTLHSDEIEDILFTYHTGHLACIAAGAPYIVPVTYAYDGGALYGAITPGCKITALRDNSAVAFGIADLSEPHRWRSVIIEGTWSEVTDPHEREQTIALLANVDQPIELDESSILFRVSPQQRSGRWLETPHRHTAMRH